MTLSTHALKFHICVSSARRVCVVASNPVTVRKRPSELEEIEAHAGGKGVSPRHRPSLLAKYILGNHFC
jgi:hypothetical protein